LVETKKLPVTKIGRLHERSEAKQRFKYESWSNFNL